MIDTADIHRAVQSLRPGVEYSVIRETADTFFVKDEISGEELVPAADILAEIQARQPYWEWLRKMRESDRTMSREAEDAVADALADGRQVSPHRLARYQAKRALRARRPGG